MKAENFTFNQFTHSKDFDTHIDASIHEWHLSLTDLQA